MIQISNPLRGRHKQLEALLEYLNREHPLNQATISITLVPMAEYLPYLGEDVTGTIKVYREYASIRIATKNRSLRAIALTVAHEYWHCIQFIQRNLFMNEGNKDELEEEAKAFAEEVLKTLWLKQNIFYPSTL